MSEDTQKLNPSHNSWDTFWQGSEAAAYSGCGLNHPVIVAFWDRYFKKLRELHEQPSIIDIASGSGAVIDRILSVFGPETKRLTCLDISKAAIDRISSKYPGVTGIVADANKVPAADKQFDIATSQFGIEYAGSGAFEETCRLVADGGHIAMVLHYKGGAIYNECTKNLAAIRRALEAKFVPLAIDLFEAGFRAIGGGDRVPYDVAATALAPAVAELEAIIAEFGTDAADETIVKLYEDVDRVHSNMPAHEPVEVLDWLRRTQHELDAYAERMSAMCDSALDEDVFERICERLRSNGFSIETASILAMSVNDVPLAWVLVANRGPAVLRDAVVAVDGEREDIEAWRQKQVEEAVRIVTDSRSYSGPLLEARPVWASPFLAMICQVREQGVEGHFHWTISGDAPTGTVDSQAAATPQEAARHFALEWHLEAARSNDETLASTAEALFVMIADDSVW
jgi:ubiquinone/menaquinone biosynthesis C-methylase UbiE